MRLRTIHPSYLDAKGLVALRRETLLAKNVLLGKTRGYRNHPQLIRFKHQEDSYLLFIDVYLFHIYYEAKKRGYNFDESKFSKKLIDKKISVTDGQVLYERNHLNQKLRIRDPQRYEIHKNEDLNYIKVNPIFEIISGDVEIREKI